MSPMLVANPAMAKDIQINETAQVNININHIMEKILDVGRDSKFGKYKKFGEKKHTKFLNFYFKQLIEKNMKIYG